MSEENTPNEPAQVEEEIEEKEPLVSVSRTSALLIMKMVVAIIIGFLLAFAAPVLFKWLASWPNEAWYAVGVAVAVVASAVFCLKERQ